MNSCPLVRQGLPGECTGDDVSRIGASQGKWGRCGDALRKMGWVIGCSAVVVGVFGGSSSEAALFLDVTSLTPGGPGLGVFSGTMGGISVSGSVGAGAPAFSLSAPGPLVGDSTTAGTSPQYSHGSVYSPTIALTDRIGFSYLGGATNTVTITFGSPVTNPVFHVANLDIAQFGFVGVAGLTLLNGNGGADGDGLAVIGGPSFSIVDANALTSDATLPTSSPPITGTPRSAYGSVQLDGTFSAITFGIGALGPGPDINGGSFTISIVPEPGSMLLLGLGVSCMAGFGRRRARRVQGTV